MSNRTQMNIQGLAWGGVVGILGGLVGLGGAEFRLPLLTSVFRYQIFTAILVNLMVSLTTVTFSFLFRSKHIPFASIAFHTPILFNLLAGSLLGAVAGVYFSAKTPKHWLHRIAALLLIVLSIVLMGHDWLLSSHGLVFPPLIRFAVGFVAGIVIGVISSLLGVAGGELIIPTLVLLFSIDIKLAGSLSLAISIPTILVGLWRYHRRYNLRELWPEAGFILWMAVGSMGGAWLGSLLLPSVSNSFLHLALGMILLISAGKMLRHGY